MSLTIDSTRFGRIEVDPDSVIEFPHGLIGFESRRYALIAREPRANAPPSGSGSCGTSERTPGHSRTGRARGPAATEAMSSSGNSRVTARRG